MAARLGGDTDTVGAMAGAVAGACAGAGALPAGSVERIEKVNGLGLAAAGPWAARAEDVALTLETGTV